MFLGADTAAVTMACFISYCDTEPVLSAEDSDREVWLAVSRKRPEAAYGKAKKNIL
jgi:hypothetical protein